MLKRKKPEKEMDGAETLRAKKKKTVNRGCSQMRQINRAFSGGGAKVSAATVSQDSDDTDPAGSHFLIAKANIFQESLCSKFKKYYLNI